MRLPEFLIIGAQKAGTTWLRALLRRHPAVYMPDREVHFFNKDPHYEQGLDWYARWFQAVDDGQLVGEKSPNYLWTNVPAEGSDAPNGHRRIADAIPDVQLIALLRDPVDRAISAYNHHLCRGRLPPHVSMERVLFGDHQHLCRRHGILTMGAYDRHLKDYLEVFDRDQLLVLIFEEHVVADPDAGLRRACAFLDLDPARVEAEPGAPRHVHSFSKPRAYLHYWLQLPLVLTRPVDLFAQPWKRKASPEMRARLEAHYAPHAEALYDLLGRRIKTWSVS
jgi:hypothetical protein